MSLFDEHFEAGALDGHLYYFGQPVELYPGENLSAGSSVTGVFTEQEETFIRRGQLLCDPDTEVEIGDWWQIEGEYWRTLFIEPATGVLTVQLHEPLPELVTVRVISWQKGAMGALERVVDSEEINVRSVRTLESSDDEQEEGRRQVRARYRFYWEQYRDLGQDHEIEDEEGNVYRVQSNSDPENLTELPHTVAEILRYAEERIG